MSEELKKESPARVQTDTKPPRMRGVGDPNSHSQDADRHRKVKHQKSEKQEITN